MATFSVAEFDERLKILGVPEGTGERFFKHIRKMMLDYPMLSAEQHMLGTVKASACSVTEKFGDETSFEVMLKVMAMCRLWGLGNDRIGKAFSDGVRKAVRA